MIKSATLGTNKSEFGNLRAKYAGKDKEIDVKVKKEIPIRINSDKVSFEEKGQSYITTITLTYTRPKINATLDEKDVNIESTISEMKGKNKTLTLNRTFKPSQLNTMCLPFNLSMEMIKGIFGSGTKIYSYNGYQNGELSFSTAKEEVFDAGKPFLMRPEYYVEHPTFAGVTVENTSAQTVDGGDWDFCGTFGTLELAADGTQLFLTADGTLAKPEAGKQKMRGFRCYLKKAAGTVNGSAQLPSVTIDGETNTIKAAEFAAPTSVPTAYSLSGMKLNADGKVANGGIMIINGKKFVMTNR